MIAKIATDEAKPNGYLFVPIGSEKEFLAPLPVNKFSGVGESTFLKLKQMNINFIGDILHSDINLLEKELGKWGTDLYRKAQGISNSQVHNYREAKSISTENTFEENISNYELLLAELVRMTEKVGYELRQDKKLTGCIAVKIRYPNFETVSKQVTIDYTFSDDELIPFAIELFKKLWKPNSPIRLLGVKLSELNNFSVQGSLFENREKKTSLYKAIDDVKNRFGKNTLQKARTIVNKN
jgi:DNA polymerase-4